MLSKLLAPVLLAAAVAAQNFQVLRVSEFVAADQVYTGPNTHQSSPAACRALCASTTDCTSYLYLFWDQACFTMSSFNMVEVSRPFFNTSDSELGIVGVSSQGIGASPLPAQWTDGSNVTSVFNAQQGGNSTTFQTVQAAPGYHAPSFHDGARLSSTDVDTCRLSCLTASQGCVAYAYEQDVGCQLFVDIADIDVHPIEDDGKSFEIGALGFATINGRPSYPFTGNEVTEDLQVIGPVKNAKNVEVALPASAPAYSKRSRLSRRRLSAWR